jgi:hypothetical protein
MSNSRPNFQQPADEKAQALKKESLLNLLGSLIKPLEGNSFSTELGKLKKELEDILEECKKDNLEDCIQDLHMLTTVEWEGLPEKKINLNQSFAGGDLTTTYGLPLTSYISLAEYDYVVSTLYPKINDFLKKEEANELKIAEQMELTKRSVIEKHLTPAIKKEKEAIITEFPSFLILEQNILLKRQKIDSLNRELRQTKNEKSGLEKDISKFDSAISENLKKIDSAQSNPKSFYESYFSEEEKRERKRIYDMESASALESNSVISYTEDEFNEKHVSYAIQLINKEITHLNSEKEKMEKSCDIEMKKIIAKENILKKEIEENEELMEKTEKNYDRNMKGILKEKYIHYQTLLELDSMPIDQWIEKNLKKLSPETVKAITDELPGALVGRVASIKTKDEPILVNLSGEKKRHAITPSDLVNFGHAFRENYKTTLEDILKLEKTLDSKRKISTVLPELLIKCKINIKYPPELFYFSYAIHGFKDVWYKLAPEMAISLQHIGDLFDSHKKNIYIDVYTSFSQDLALESRNFLAEATRELLWDQAHTNIRRSEEKILNKFLAFSPEKTVSKASHSESFTSEQKKNIKELDKMESGYKEKLKKAFIGKDKAQDLKTNLSKIAAIHHLKKLVEIGKKVPLEQMKMCYPEAFYTPKLAREKNSLERFIMDFNKKDFKHSVPVPEKTSILGSLFKNKKNKIEQTNTIVGSQTSFLPETEDLSHDDESWEMVEPIEQVKQPPKEKPVSVVGSGLGLMKHSGTLDKLPEKLMDELTNLPVATKTLPMQDNQTKKTEQKTVVLKKR